MTGTIDIGFIGLGQMGAPMAERLLGEDVRLHVYDRSPDAVAKFSAAGAAVHGSPKEVADAAGIVFACLPSREISEQVAFGENGVIHGGALKIYVEMSTIGRVCIGRIAGELAGRGIQVVDGPISGGPPAAREGRLAMMVSGPADAVEAVQPWLGRIGRKVYVLGNRAGQAQIMKLVNNLLMATNMVVASEGLVMGAKAGLDPEMMVEVLGASTGGSNALAGIIARTALTGNFNFGAYLSIVDKDVDLGVAEAEALSVPLPAIEAAGEIWHAAAHGGFKDRDFTEITRFIEQNGGADLRSRKGGGNAEEGTVER